ncbi:hypothetical protein FOA52_002947 [Chlamydomonas sp. UWO 241]|nr:hypothetical protein FOA52_002947 [Chlamydomonas sp. UWO 241]
MAPKTRGAAVEEPRPASTKKEGTKQEHWKTREKREREELEAKAGSPKADASHQPTDSDIPAPKTRRQLAAELELEAKPVQPPAGKAKPKSAPTKVAPKTRSGGQVSKQATVGPSSPQPSSGKRTGGKAAAAQPSAKKQRMADSSSGAESSSDEESSSEGGEGEDVDDVRDSDFIELLDDCDEDKGGEEGGDDEGEEEEGKAEEEEEEEEEMQVIPVPRPRGRPSKRAKLAASARAAPSPARATRSAAGAGGEEGGDEEDEEQEEEEEVDVMPARRPRGRPSELAKLATSTHAARMTRNGAGAGGAEGADEEEQEEEEAMPVRRPQGRPSKLAKLAASASAAARKPAAAAAHLPSRADVDPDLVAAIETGEVNPYALDGMPRYVWPDLHEASDDAVQELGRSVPIVIRFVGFPQAWNDSVVGKELQTMEQDASECPRLYNIPLSMPIVAIRRKVCREFCQYFWPEMVMLLDPDTGKLLSDEEDGKTARLSTYGVKPGAVISMMMSKFKRQIEEDVAQAVLDAEEEEADAVACAAAQEEEEEAAAATAADAAEKAIAAAAKAAAAFAKASAKKARTAAPAAAAAPATAPQPVFTSCKGKGPMPKPEPPRQSLRTRNTDPGAAGTSRDVPAPAARGRPAMPMKGPKMPGAMVDPVNDRILKVPVRGRNAPAAVVKASPKVGKAATTGGGAAPSVASPAGKKKRFWDLPQTEALLDGVKQHGRAWRTIQASHGTRMPAFTDVDIKDRWENLVKAHANKFQGQRKPFTKKIKQMLRNLLEDNQPWPDSNWRAPPPGGQ